MPYAILLAPEAIADLKKLKVPLRSDVRDAISTHLRHQRARTSRSRIKRLRGVSRPQYRLRVGDVRVFYDISGDTVEILAIIQKLEAASWLAQFGKAE